ncbi:hypothetical protein [Paraflavitalea speifideaquila]|uniref:hypothetical protein n=1 Tax=Paraflavitalea speifideaquila TaxID=3076558 RepID=UPI0028EFDDD8|nr:hypothetical protein [Paraflavitalea speifideiaquila]
MKTTVLLITVLFSSLLSYTQQSDFIVLKKWNNRTIKTFYPGAFISAQTHQGYNINGFITDIRNDSLFIRQEETRLRGTEFGTELDTVRFAIGIDYREISRFNYSGKYQWGGRKKGFAQIVVPKIMMVAGVGYIILETVNTIYRKESFNDDGKLVTLGVAAAVAVAGYLWEHTRAKRDKAGGKYKVVYIKAADLKKSF